MISENKQPTMGINDFHRPGPAYSVPRGGKHQGTRLPLLNSADGITAAGEDWGGAGHRGSGGE